jgi:two-component system chemotaxis response regulator CheB
MRHRATRGAGARPDIMPIKRIVVVGASSGGIEALRILASGLPADFPAAVCVVVHTSPQSPGLLDVILNRVGTLPTVTATTGMRLEHGRIYVAPPDHHLLVEPGSLTLSRGPKENRFRPAIDPLFRSAAQVYGPSAIGVILSGSLDDGTAGLVTIKRLGGLAIVQDPADALFPSMPLSALNHAAVDHVSSVSLMPSLLTQLVGTTADITPVAVPEDVEVEVKIARELNPLDSGLGEIAEPSPFACPECHGVLLRLKEADPPRFRCHTGHGYSADSLIAEMNESIEAALWSAMRALQEGSLLLQHMANHLQARGERAGADTLIEQVASTKQQAEIVRKLATERAGLVPAPARK